MKTLNCSSRLSRSNFDKPAEYFRLKVGNILARSEKLTYEKFHRKNSYRQSSPVNTRKEVSTTVTNFIIKKSELFLLEVRKNSNFFFVTPKFLVKMLLYTSWFLFGHPCSKCFAQSWRRIEKIQEIQKRYFFPSKVLDYSKLAVPCQRGEIPLGKICSFEKMDFKINNVVRKDCLGMSFRKVFSSTSSQFTKKEIFSPSKTWRYVELSFLRKHDCVFLKKHL